MPSPTKVRAGIGSPHSPLPFAPNPGRCHARERQQPLTPAGPAAPKSLPPLFWTEGEEGDGSFAKSPLTFFLFLPSSPLLYFSLSPLFEINPTPLNHTTKQPLLSYKQALRPF
jgi:hypothetical protein